MNKFITMSVDKRILIVSFQDKTNDEFKRKFTSFLNDKDVEKYENETTPNGYLFDLNIGGCKCSVTIDYSIKEMIIKVYNYEEYKDDMIDLIIKYFCN